MRARAWASQRCWRRPAGGAAAPDDSRSPPCSPRARRLQQAINQSLRFILNTKTATSVASARLLEERSRHSRSTSRPIAYSSLPAAAPVSHKLLSLSLDDRPIAMRWASRAGGALDGALDWSCQLALASLLASCSPPPTSDQSIITIYTLYKDSNFGGIGATAGRDGWKRGARLLGASARRRPPPPVAAMFARRPAGERPRRRRPESPPPGPATPPARPAALPPAPRPPPARRPAGGGAGRTRRRAAPASGSKRRQRWAAAGQGSGGRDSVEAHLRGGGGRGGRGAGGRSGVRLHGGARRLAAEAPFFHRPVNS